MGWTDAGREHQKEVADLLNGESSSDQALDGARAAIAEQASLFRAVLLEGSRSSTLANLFDFLLERANGDRSPKEIEIAMEVFGKSGTFDTSQDSMVRSHVHRLRQRLDRFNAGKSGPRLTIPKGEYRLVLTEMPEDADGHAPRSELPIPYAKRVWWSRRTAFILLAANAALWGLVLLFMNVRNSPTSLARTAIWKPIVTNGRAPVIAVGDFYMIAESGDDGRMERVLLSPAIQSEAQLASYLMANPQWQGKLHARDIYRVPGSVAKAALAVQRQLSTMAPGSSAALITPVSRMSQDRIDSSNIIYVQYFSQLGMLRSPILHLSGFAPTDDFDEIVDLASGRIYRSHQSDEPSRDGRGGTAGAKSVGLDYGYLASFAGASGNHNILISGISDAGLSQMVKIVADESQVADLARKTGGTTNFEALYQVRIQGGLVYDTKLLMVRSLKADTAPGRNR